MRIRGESVLAYDLMWFATSIIALMWIYYICNVSDRFFHSVFNASYKIWGDKFVKYLGSLSEYEKNHKVRTKFMPMVGVFVLSFVIPVVVYQFYLMYSTISQISSIIYAFVILIYMYLFISSITDSEKDAYQKLASIIQYLIIGFAISKFFEWLLFSNLMIPDYEFVPLLLLVGIAELMFIYVPNFISQLAEANMETVFRLNLYKTLFNERSFSTTNLFKITFIIYLIGIALIGYIAFIVIAILSLYALIDLGLVVQYIFGVSIILLILTVFALVDHVHVLIHNGELLSYEAKIPAQFRPDINFILETLWPNTKLYNINGLLHVPITKIKNLTPQECYSLTIVGINTLSDVINFSLVNVHIETKVTYEVLSNLEYIYKRFQSFVQAWNKFIGEKAQAKN